MQQLAKTDAEAAFKEMGELLYRATKVAEIAVYGGAAILLQVEAEFRTGDVDADGPAMRPVGEHGPAPSLYFAYGSNLHRDDMAARCPGSVPIRPLTLKDWVLVFRFYADIVPSPGKVVEGALYSVTPTDVAALDEYEGVSEGLYRRHTLVLDDTGEEIFFYVMNRGDVAPPSEAYLDVIKTGFANWHIPLDTLNDAVSRADEDLQIGHIPG